MVITGRQVEGGVLVLVPTVGVGHEKVEYNDVRGAWFRDAINVEDKIGPGDRTLAVKVMSATEKFGRIPMLPV